MRRYVQNFLHVPRSKARKNADGTPDKPKKETIMDEHKFKSIYLVGYGDAVQDSKNKSWLKTTIISITIATIAFWAGRASMKPTITSAYETGFEAGIRERTTEWSEWK